VPGSAEFFILTNPGTNSLAPGAVYWRTNTASVPVTLSGRYYLVLNTGFLLSDSDNSNNTAIVPVNFNIAPSDLKPIAFYAPNALTGAPNPSVTVIIGVTNQGVSTALAAYDALYISATATRDQSARLVATWPRTNAIAPGQSYWLTNTVRLPVSESGNYYLVFEADIYRNLRESAPLNNVAAVPIYLQLSLEPDLVVSEFQWPSAVVGPANPTVQLSWHVVNEGLGPAVGPWTDSILLYTNYYGPWTLVKAYDESLVLPVGSGYQRTNTLTLPITQSGTYSIGVQVNSSNDVFELNYNNNGNLMPFTFTLTSSPRLEFEAGQFVDGGVFRLQVSAPVGLYTLQSSTNLIDWIPLLDFTCTNSPTWVEDRDAPQFVSRYYRVAPSAR
jgi:hypothetical protein